MSTFYDKVDILPIIQEGNESEYSLEFNTSGTSQISDHDDEVSVNGDDEGFLEDEESSEDEYENATIVFVEANDSDAALEEDEVTDDDGEDEDLVVENAVKSEKKTEVQDIGDNRKPSMLRLAIIEMLSEKMNKPLTSDESSSEEELPQKGNKSVNIGSIQQLELFYDRMKRGLPIANVDVDSAIDETDVKRNDRAEREICTDDEVISDQSPLNTDLADEYDVDESLDRMQAEQILMPEARQSPNRTDMVEWTEADDELDQMLADSLLMPAVRPFANPTDMVEWTAEDDKLDQMLADSLLMPEARPYLGAIPKQITRHPITTEEDDKLDQMLADSILMPEARPYLGAIPKQITRHPITTEEDDKLDQMLADSILMPEARPYLGAIPKQITRPPVTTEEDDKFDQMLADSILMPKARPPTENSPTETSTISGIVSKVLSHIPILSKLSPVITRMMTPNKTLKETTAVSETSKKISPSEIPKPERTFSGLIIKSIPKDQPLFYWKPGDPIPKNYQELLRERMRRIIGPEITPADFESPEKTSNKEEPIVKKTPHIQVTKTTFSGFSTSKVAVQKPGTHLKTTSSSGISKPERTFSGLIIKSIPKDQPLFYWKPGDPIPKNYKEMLRERMRRVIGPEITPADFESPEKTSNEEEPVLKKTPHIQVPKTTFSGLPIKTKPSGSVPKQTAQMSFPSKTSTVAVKKTTFSGLPIKIPSTSQKQSQRVSSSSKTSPIAVTKTTFSGLPIKPTSSTTNRKTATQLAASSNTSRVTVEKPVAHPKTTSSSGIPNPERTFSGLVIKSIPKDQPLFYWKPGDPIPKNYQELLRERMRRIIGPEITPADFESPEKTSNEEEPVVKKTPHIQVPKTTFSGLPIKTASLTTHPKMTTYLAASSKTSLAPVQKTTFSGIPIRTPSPSQTQSPGLTAPLKISVGVPKTTFSGLPIKSPSSMRTQSPRLVESSKTSVAVQKTTFSGLPLKSSTLVKKQSPHLAASSKSAVGVPKTTFSGLPIKITPPTGAKQTTRVAASTKSPTVAVSKTTFSGLPLNRATGAVPKQPSRQTAQSSRPAVAPIKATGIVANQTTRSKTTFSGLPIKSPPKNQSLFYWTRGQEIPENYIELLRERMRHFIGPPLTLADFESPVKGSNAETAVVNESISHTAPTTSVRASLFDRLQAAQNPDILPQNFNDNELRNRAAEQPILKNDYDIPTKMPVARTSMMASLIAAQGPDSPPLKANNHQLRNATADQHISQNYDDIPVKMPAVKTSIMDRLIAGQDLDVPLPKLNNKVVPNNYDDKPIKVESIMDKILAARKPNTLIPFDYKEKDEEHNLSEYDDIGAEEEEYQENEEEYYEDINEEFEDVEFKEDTDKNYSANTSLLNRERMKLLGPPDLSTMPKWAVTATKTITVDQSESTVYSDSPSLPVDSDLSDRNVTYIKSSPGTKSQDQLDSTLQDSMMKLLLDLPNLSAMPKWAVAPTRNINAKQRNDTTPTTKTVFRPTDSQSTSSKFGNVTYLMANKSSLQEQCSLDSSITDSDADNRLALEMQTWPKHFYIRRNIEIGEGHDLHNEEVDEGLEIDNENIDQKVAMNSTELLRENMIKLLGPPNLDTMPKWAVAASKTVQVEQRESSNGKIENIKSAVENTLQLRELDSSINEAEFDNQLALDMEKWPKVVYRQRNIATIQPDKSPPTTMGYVENNKRNFNDADKTPTNEYSDNAVEQEEVYFEELNEEEVDENASRNILETSSEVRRERMLKLLGPPNPHAMPRWAVAASKNVTVQEIERNHDTTPTNEYSDNEAEREEEYEEEFNEEDVDENASKNTVHTPSEVRRERMLKLLGPPNPEKMPKWAVAASKNVTVQETERNHDKTPISEYSDTAAEREEEYYDEFNEEEVDENTSKDILETSSEVHHERMLKLLDPPNPDVMFRWAVASTSSVTIKQSEPFNERIPFTITKPSRNNSYSPGLRIDKTTSSVGRTPPHIAKKPVSSETLQSSESDSEVDKQLMQDIRTWPKLVYKRREETTPPYHGSQRIFDYKQNDEDSEEYYDDGNVDVKDDERIISESIADNYEELQRERVTKHAREETGITRSAQKTPILTRKEKSKSPFVTPETQMLRINEHAWKERGIAAQKTPILFRKEKSKSPSVSPKTRIPRTIQPRTNEHAWKEPGIAAQKTPILFRKEKSKSPSVSPKTQIPGTNEHAWKETGIAAPKTPVFFRKEKSKSPSVSPKTRIPRTIQPRTNEHAWKEPGIAAQKTPILFRKEKSKSPSVSPKTQIPGTNEHAWKETGIAAPKTPVLFRKEKSKSPSVSPKTRIPRTIQPRTNEHAWKEPGIATQKTPILIRKEKSKSPVVANKTKTPPTKSPRAAASAITSTIVLPIKTSGSIIPRMEIKRLVWKGKKSPPTKETTMKKLALPTLASRSGVISKATSGAVPKKNSPTAGRYLSAIPQLVTVIKTISPGASVTVQKSKIPVPGTCSGIPRKQVPQNTSVASTNIINTGAIPKTLGARMVNRK